MSIYHLTVKIGSKENGDSAGSKLAYISRTEAYAKKADECAYTASGHMPKWPKTNPQIDASHYWKSADLYERDNGRLYREVEFALPRELSLEKQKELCHAFAERLCVLDKGEKLPFTFAIHTDKENHNPHCHLMISERINDGIPRNASTWFKRANAREPKKGGATKTQELKGKQWLLPTRELWAEMANEAMKSALPDFHQRSDGIDHRSNKARGLSKIPTQHLGATCTDMLKRGAHCNRGYKVALHNKKVATCNRFLKSYPEPRTHFARMVIGGLRTLSTRAFGALRKDGSPKTMKDILRDIEYFVADFMRASRIIAESQAKRAQMELELLYAKPRVLRVPGMDHFLTSCDLQRVMTAPLLPVKLPRQYRYKVDVTQARQEMPLLVEAFETCAQDDKANAYDITLSELQKLPVDHPIRMGANDALTELLTHVAEPKESPYTRFDMAAKIFGQWYIDTMREYKKALADHEGTSKSHQHPPPASARHKSPFYLQWKYVPRFAKEE